MKSSCPLQPIEKRLDDCFLLWENLKSNYFSPESFILNLNSLIQALRSVTFILQKNKKFIKEFDNWYSSWQEAMKRNEILSWLKNARNYIEKEGDLETFSKAKISIVNSYNEPPIFEIDLPPFIKNEEILNTIIESKPKEVNLNKGFLKIERMWVDSKFKSKDLVELTFYVYIVLLNILIDAHKNLSDLEYLNKCTWYISNLSSMDKIVSMLDQEWDRTMWMDLRTKEFTQIKAEKIEFDINAAKKASIRYEMNPKEEIKKIQNSKNLKTLAEILFNQAKKILLKDGTHVPVVFLVYPDNKISQIPFYVKNREEKYLFFRYIASIVKKTFAIAIIILGEAWTSKPLSNDNKQFVPPSDDPNRKEILWLVAANNKGEKFNFAVYFSKNSDGETVLGKEISNENIKGDVNCFLGPIFKIWF